MRCNDLQDQINAFAAGDLTPIHAWRLRRHVRQCHVCSGRLQRARTVNVGLAGLGVAAPSDTLRQQVFADIEFLASKVTEEEMVWCGREELKRRKRRYAYVGALTAVAVTGIIGASARMLLAPAAFTTFTDSDGQVWRLSGNYTGEVEISDTHRSITPGMIFVNLGDDPGGVLNIDVGDQHLAVHNFGNNVLRNDHGEFIGTAVLYWYRPSISPPAPAVKPDPMSPLIKRWAPEMWNTTQSIVAFPWGAVGVDRPTGVVWRMRGLGRVQVLKPGDSKPFASAQNRSLSLKGLARLSPEQMAAAERIIPELTWTVHGRVAHATGFGTHALRDENGRTLLVLKVEPLPK